MVTTPDHTPGAYRALLNATDGIVRQVVELHQPTNDAWQNCQACNPDCDQAECWTVWPCPTTKLIAEHVGVPLDPRRYTIDVVTSTMSGSSPAGAPTDSPPCPSSPSPTPGLDRS